MVHDPIELAAIDRGAGSPVAFVHGGVIHGGPAWAKNFRAAVEGGYRAIVVDRRGHGRSEAGDAEHIPVHLHADDLRLTLELRECEMAHLVGVSYGSLVCLEFALSWPDRVLSMTLLEPPLMTLVRDDPDFKVWFDEFVEVRKYAAEGAPLDEWVPKWLSLIDQRLARGTRPGSPVWPIVEKQAPLIFKEEAGWEYAPDQSTLSELRVPALILSGDQSEPPMQLIAEILAETLPLAEHRWIAGAGHDAHATKSDEFNDLLLQFIARHDLA